jgi:hypothetical protein
MKGEFHMSRFIILSLVLATMGLGACSTTCDRGTASDDEAKVYKPTMGEVKSHF